MRRGPRLLVGVAAAAGVLVVLAGCSAPAPPPRPATARPAPSFPAVPGRVLSASGSEVEWHRVVRVDDGEAGYAEARRLLVAGGFVLTKDRQGTGGGDGQACTPDLCVGFTATSAGDGPTVAYDVFRPTGIVD
jgi:hypothetical protein